MALKVESPFGRPRPAQIARRCSGVSADPWSRSFTSSSTSPWDFGAAGHDPRPRPQRDRGVERGRNPVFGSFAHDDAVTGVVLEGRSGKKFAEHDDPKPDP